MSFTVEGLRELEAALLDMNLVTAKNIGRRALRSAGLPVAAKMNAYAPVNQEGLSDDGPLNESYTVSTRLNKSQAKQERREGRDDVFMYIGTNDVAGPQQEFGNERHNPQSHARPAWYAEQLPTLDRTKENLSVEIEKAAARQARKAAKA